MSESIKVDVPTVGESISEVQIGQWLKKEGDWVKSGEDLVEIETEKASVQIPAPASGILEKIAKKSEEFATIGETIASIRPSESPAPGDAAPTAAPAGAGAPGEPTRAPAAAPTPAPAPSPTATTPAGQATTFAMPAAKRLLEEHGLSASQVPATGPGGRLLKEDVLAFVRRHGEAADAAPASPAPADSAPADSASASPAPTAVVPTSRPTAATSLVAESLPNRREEVKPMSMLRRTIAARLVEAQQTAALLTTFNEIDMQNVMSIRSKYRDAFAERHGVKLGFMSFFAKASVEALRRYPLVNAEVRDGNIVMRHYHDIGVAIGGGKGLVVPILRNVERMSFADVELGISEFARQAGENRLQPTDLIGGTFTISNGGVYGSLLSTPIVNPPQSGILGLHSIQERPVAIDGKVVIRPMMYVALTYDHRVVDGREAVGFLKTIKEVIEDPSRLFLEL
ncbi:MAG: 2-oxoglutarate dehydrogenase complex dihydrolipoyllysine-residue succinyltransferase [Novipirellula sp. JB048]